ncbi:MAG: DUF1634 domain-containing protein [Deltaproteobacteria bacterium]|nr:DUF1634 domain-containing protein [Deltaproteobacteria bacterium]
MAATRPPAGWSDSDVERVIGNLLRVGLLIATAVVLFGGAIYLARHGHELPDYRIFRGEPAQLRSIAGIVEMAADWFGRGFIQLGLLVLLATPVARVAFSVFAFVEQRDPFYVGVTLVVLAVLLYSIVGGYFL